MPAISAVDALQEPEPSPTHCINRYMPLYLFTQGRGEGGEPVRKLEGRQFTRGVENANITDCISSI
jgi:hypothetical protein